MSSGCLAAVDQEEWVVVRLPIAEVRAGADGGALVPERQVVRAGGRAAPARQAGLEVSIGPHEGQQAEEPAGREQTQDPEPEALPV